MIKERKKEYRPLSNKVQEENGGSPIHVGREAGKWRYRRKGQRENDKRMLKTSEWKGVFGGIISWVMHCQDCLPTSSSFFFFFGCFGEDGASFGGLSLRISTFVLPIPFSIFEEENLFICLLLLEDCIWRKDQRWEKTTNIISGNNLRSSSFFV